MHILHALFGSPAQVAERHTLRFEAHQLMASWLRAGEAMMRRLLLIEASAYAKPSTRPLLRPSRKRTRKPMSFTPDAPEQWRVNFRCLSTLPGRSAKREEPGPMVQHAAADKWAPDRRMLAHAGPGDVGGKRLSREDRWCSENQKPARFRSAWPLAERYEALLRVFNNPAPYARRLSRRLHATPHRAGAMLRAPPEAQHRVDHFDAFTQAAETACATFNSS